MPNIENYYKADFAKIDKDFILKESGCNNIYIYPSDQLMYLCLDKLKRGYFSYPNFTWTCQRLEKEIIDDIIKQCIDCFIVPPILFQDKTIKKNIKKRNYMERP